MSSQEWLNLVEAEERKKQELLVLQQRLREELAAEEFFEEIGAQPINWVDDEIQCRARTTPSDKTKEEIQVVEQTLKEIAKRKAELEQSEKQVTQAREAVGSPDGAPSDFGGDVGDQVTTGTDSAYEESRQKAEQTFYAGFNEWLKSLDEAAAELAEQMERFDREAEKVEQLDDIPAKLEIMSKRAFAKLEISKRIQDELTTLCSDYVRAVVRAFAEILFRRGVPPSQIEEQVDSHTERIISKERSYGKLKNASVEVLERGLPYEWADCWLWVHDKIESFLRAEMRPWIWSGEYDGQAAAAAPEASGTPVNLLGSAPPADLPQQMASRAGGVRLEKQDGTTETSQESSLRKELRDIAEQATLYFGRIATQATEESDLSASDHQLAEQLSTRVRQAVASIADAVSSSPLVGAVDRTSLNVAMKAMVAALHFRRYQHWDTYAMYDEDVYRGTREAGESDEFPLAMTEGLPVFRENYNRLVGYLDLLEARKSEAFLSNIIPEATGEGTTPSQGARSGSPSGAPFKRAGDWKPSIRNDAIRKVKNRLGNKATQERICQELDMLEVPILDDWERSFDVRLWTDAYKNPKLRNRLKKMISSA